MQRGMAGLSGGGSGGGATSATLAGNSPFREMGAFVGRYPAGGSRLQNHLETAREAADRGTVEPDPGEATHTAGGWSWRSPACCRKLPSWRTREGKESPFHCTVSPGPCRQSLTPCQWAKGKCSQSPAQVPYSRQGRVNWELRDRKSITAPSTPPAARPPSLPFTCRNPRVTIKQLCLSTQRDPAVPLTHDKALTLSLK